MPIELYPRTHFAELHDADVLVSIHANALPDGVNPFTNSGTSVYYFQPRSIRLARELDRALVTEFRVRDLGIGRGDYALVRPTWMPAALTEGLFVMLPEQEAVLASEDGQWRYARGGGHGVENILREGARGPGPTGMGNAESGTTVAARAHGASAPCRSACANSHSTLWGASFAPAPA